MKPEESSNGVDSGGKPFKRPLDAATSAKMANALNTALTAKAVRADSN